MASCTCTAVSSDCSADSYGANAASCLAVLRASLADCSCVQLPLHHPELTRRSRCLLLGGLQLYGQACCSTLSCLPVSGLRSGQLYLHKTQLQLQRRQLLQLGRVDGLLLPDGGVLGGALVCERVGQRQQVVNLLL